MLVEKVCTTYQKAVFVVEYEAIKQQCNNYIDSLGIKNASCQTVKHFLDMKENYDIIAVIGDGNSALQYALELSSYCPKVYVCTLFDKFFGDDVLVNRLKSRDNIEIIHNVSLQQFKFNDELEGLVFKNTKNDYR